MAKTSSTAGTADSFTPKIAMTPNNCNTRVAKAKVTSTAAQKFNKSTITACKGEIKVELFQENKKKKISLKLGVE